MVGGSHTSDNGASRLSVRRVQRDPTTDTVYVASNPTSNPGIVEVISGKTIKVTATIPVGSGPIGVAVNPPIQQASTATLPSSTDLIRPTQAYDLHKRPASTSMQVVYTEDVTGHGERVR
jgi:YVTN family beta-propeller protein